MNKIEQGLVDLGVGVASYIIIDTLSTSIKKMEKEGKLNSKEGKRMMQETISKYQASGAKYANEAQSHIDKMIKDGPFATKVELAELNMKIDKLVRLSSKSSKASKVPKKANVARKMRAANAKK